MNKVYTAQEVADKLKIKKSTVYDLIKRGELSSSKVGKQLRVSEEQLSQYLKGSECSASSAQSYDHQPESSLLKRDYLLHSSGLIISGQASPALDLLLNQLPTHPDNLPVLQSHMNTYNGLYSLYFEKVHIACASASPEDIHSLIPGIPLTVISLCQYPVGFYVKKENPKNIRGFSDLTTAKKEAAVVSFLTVHFCLPKFHRIPYPDIEMSLLPITPRLLQWLANRQT